MFTFHSCFAGDVISSYYTDNGKYETSNFYANASVSISNDSNSLIKEKVNKYITTGTNNSRSGNAYSKNNKYPLDDNTGSKKIYNTIIIKTKKTNNNSNRKAIPNNYVIDDVYKTNHINEIKNNINKNKITYTNGNKNNIFTKSSTRDSFESKTKSRFAPFAKTTPDGWYVYALGSFAFLSPSNLSIKALDANNNVTNYGIVSDSAINTRWASGDFGGILGAKFYLNRNKVAAFIAPEMFYSSTNLSSGNTVYNSKQHINNYVDPVDQRTGIDLNLPVDLFLKPKSVFGGSLRFGVTFLNTISVFTKVNLGAMLANINVSSRANAIDWDAIGIVDPDTRAKIIDEYSQKGAERYNKLLLMYGFGCGIELTAYNQHLILRLDYDYNIIDSVFKLNGTAYGRITDGTQKLDDGDKWKTKIRFGTIKLSIGFAI